MPDAFCMRAPGADVPWLYREASLPRCGCVADRCNVAFCCLGTCLSLSTVPPAARCAPLRAVADALCERSRVAALSHFSGSVQMPSSLRSSSPHFSAPAFPLFSALSWFNAIGFAVQFPDSRGGASLTRPFCNARDSAVHFMLQRGPLPFPPFPA